MIVVDYERIALDALAGVNLSPEQRKREFDNLVAVMQAEVSDLRQSQIPMDESEDRMRTWAEMHVSVLRMAHP